MFPLGHPDYTNPTGNGSGTSGPTAAAGWAGEANLDVQWAYAIAPKAHIVLLATPPAETQGVQGLPNLMKAIDWAVATYPAGTVFSMSFGTSEEAFAGSSAAAAVREVRPDLPARAGQARHVLRVLRRRRVARRRAGAPPDPDGRPPVGELPEHLAVRHLGRRHPGAVRLDLGTDVGQAVPRRRQPQPGLLGLDGRGQHGGGLERELGTDRHRRRTVQRLRPAVLPVDSSQASSATTAAYPTSRGTPPSTAGCWSIAATSRVCGRAVVGRLRRHLRVVSAGRGADSRRQRVPQGGRQGRHRQPERGHLLGRVQPEHRVQRHRGAHLRHRRQWHSQEQPDVRVRRRRHGPPRAGRRLPDDHGLRPHHRVGQPQGRRATSRGSPRRRAR